MQALDLYRTLAELCGLSVQDGVEGRSLAPLLNDPTMKWDHPAFTIWSENSRGPTGIAVRTERWRYAEFGPGGLGEAMLLDEASDPHELTNLADDPRHAAVRKELSARLREYAARYASPAPRPRPCPRRAAAVMCCERRGRAKFKTGRAAARASMPDAWLPSALRRRSSGCASRAGLRRPNPRRA